MAISITWGTKVINIPKADTQLVQSSPTEIRSLDLDNFRQTLNDLQDSEDGIPFETTHNHVPPITVGGVTLARVVEIINGYTVTFEDGQYAVNLVGANSNVGDVTNVNQVSVRSANSAGLTYSKQVEDSSFGDQRVWIDVNNGLSGTLYPRGTTADPVNNLADAQAIITQRGLPKRLHLLGTLNVIASDNISGYDIEGAGTKLATLVVATGANTNDLSISDLSMSGDLNGNLQAKDAVSLSNVDDFDGKLVNCGLAGTIDLGAGGSASHDFIDCYSEVPGNSRPTLDCNSLTSLDVQFRRYSGGLTVINFNDAGNNMSIDLVAGTVEIASSCTAGTIVVRGNAKLIDNSGAGCSVVTNGLVEAEDVRTSRQIQTNRMETDPVGGTITIYDDADTGVLVQGNLFEDIAGSQAYRGQGAERRDKLT
jgi:hypothetical protein